MDLIRQIIHWRSATIVVLEDRLYDIDRIGYIGIRVRMLLKEKKTNVNLIIFKCAANRGKQRVVIYSILLTSYGVIANCHLEDIF